MINNIRQGLPDFKPMESEVTKTMKQKPISFRQWVIHNILTERNLL
ncbi:MAG: hypothetical protein NC177_06210 [Ruminococcus flavefaciens]|nr:hypothetical protein [Ruminococcus flavefaciens]